MTNNIMCHLGTKLFHRNRLFSEFEQYVDALDDTGLQHLLSLGITGTAIGNAGLIGVAHIEMEGTHWQPEESGIPTLIIPVGMDNSFGRIVDLVALQTVNPRIWWLRTGIGAMLGYWNLEEAAYFQQQLTVHATPLDWLKADCEGICILDWKGYLPIWLSDIKQIHCPDVMTGQRLSTTLERNIALPEIRVGGIQHAT